MEEETEIKVEVEELVQQPLALVKRVEVDGEAEVEANFLLFQKFRSKLVKENQG